MVFDGQGAQTFVVDWPRAWTCAEDVRAAHQALEEAGRRMGGHGAEVRCLTSVFVPSELRWLCVFSADDESVARMTAEMAQIPERYLRRGVDVMSAWVHGSELLGEGGVR